MSTYSSKNTTSLDELEVIWTDAYAREKMAQAHVKKIEQAILDLPSVALKTKPNGLHHLERLDYTTGKTVIWDQAALIKAKMLIPSVLWPFEEIFKLSMAKYDDYERAYPGTWKKLSRACKKISSKPTFSLISADFLAEAIEASCPPLNESTDGLERAWVEAKNREKEQRDIRHQAESHILTKVSPARKSVTLSLNKLKIKFSQRIEVDQKSLNILKLDVPDKEWAFDAIYRANEVAVRNIKQNIPEVWALIEGAGAAKDKKVAFKLRS